MLTPGDRLKAAACVAAMWFVLLAPHEVLAQTSNDQAGSSVSLGARRGLATERTQGVAADDTTEQRFAYTFAAGMASDYIYRGVTLSAHQPAVGAAFEARFGSFYAGSTVTSVKLPSEPAAELSFTSGFRPSLSGFDFDIGVTYFLYPGEVGGIDTDYFEFVGRVDRKLTDTVRVAAGFAYSPNVSNTGAWSKYAAAGIGIELPKLGLLPDVTASFTTSAGYLWFGNQSAALGGFALPAYATFNAGVTFKRNHFNFDLRYYDTSLSRENCFVFTGDPGARPGGRIDPVTNPEGLTSSWCRSAVVGKVWFALD
ncbi:TorF family putative porin [Bradyrhizobium sp. Ai1a-2]|uniref:TorF family putative porin n=1 Tax=Bradyrhizobium sp. Ai1a-2 TaxID=196490 RepID=UPI001361FAA1|nr:TorF family putative porin [Bradyrhizobium sp. Ai1a-2]